MTCAAEVEACKDGPDPDELTLAGARLDNAKTQLSSAQAAMDRLDLTAPFDGVVVEVNTFAGERVLPNQAVIILADLDTLYVETNDLTENEVVKIREGAKRDAWRQTPCPSCSSTGGSRASARSLANARRRYCLPCAYLPGRKRPALTLGHDGRSVFRNQRALKSKRYVVQHPAQLAATLPFSRVLERQYDDHQLPRAQER